MLSGGAGIALGQHGEDAIDLAIDELRRERRQQVVTHLLPRAWSGQSSETIDAPVARDLGMSRWAARRLGYINQAVDRKGV
jgi:hypothetical protein